MNDGRLASTRRQDGPNVPTLTAMAASAHDVAAALRERIPGLPAVKLHKLLYYCQGHHLAHFARPLFTETISAWDMGPVVGELWHQEKEGEELPLRGELDEAQLNTIGYVVSRYGALSGQDLRHLTHSEAPWQRADAHRRPRESARIEVEWLKDHFSHELDEDDEDDEIPLDSAAIAEWLKDAPRRAEAPARTDSLDDLRARLSAGA